MSENESRQKRLAEAGLLKDGKPDPELMARAILTWLEENPESAQKLYRELALFDEEIKKSDELQKTITALASLGKAYSEFIKPSKLKTRSTTLGESWLKVGKYLEQGMEAVREKELINNE